jgi:hypothetical protein
MLSRQPIGPSSSNVTVIVTGLPVAGLAGEELIVTRSGPSGVGLGVNLNAPQLGS